MGKKKKKKNNPLKMKVEGYDFFFSKLQLVQKYFALLLGN